MNIFGLQIGGKKKALTNLFGKVIRVGNEMVIYPNDSADYIADGYQANDFFYSIVKLITNKVCLPEWGVYEIKDKKKYYKAKALFSSLKSDSSKVNGIFQEYLFLKEQAIERVNDSKLDNLLQYPNDNQTFDDLLTEACIFYNSTGNVFISASLIEGGANQGKPQSLFSLPVQGTTIIPNGYFPSSAARYEVSINGKPLPFTREQVLHLKLTNPDYSMSGSELYGQSPLRAAAGLLASTNESTKSNATAMKNMGRDGMVYLDDPNVDPSSAITQMSLTKDQWYKENYATDNKKGIGFTHTKLGFLKFGLSPVDLAIVQSEKWSLNRFCNVFGVPLVLMLPENATLNNMKEAEKSLTTRTAIPFLDMWRDGFNRKLKTDWGYKGDSKFVDYDTSCFYELQDDMVEKANWMEKMWHLTLRQRFDLSGNEYPPNLTDEQLDTVYVPGSLKALQDLGLDAQMNAADNALNKSGLNDYRL